MTTQTSMITVPDFKYNEQMQFFTSLVFKGYKCCLITFIILNLSNFSTTISLFVLQNHDEFIFCHIWWNFTDLNWARCIFNTGMLINFQHSSVWIFHGTFVNQTLCNWTTLTTTVYRCYTNHAKKLVSWHLPLRHLQTGGLCFGKVLLLECPLRWQPAQSD